MLIVEEGAKKDNEKFYKKRDLERITQLMAEINELICYLQYEQSFLTELLVSSFSLPKPEVVKVENFKVSTPFNNSLLYILCMLLFIYTKVHWGPRLNAKTKQDELLSLINCYTKLQHSCEISNFKHKRVFSVIPLTKLLFPSSWHWAEQLCSRFLFPVPVIGTDSLLSLALVIRRQSLCWKVLEICV